MPSVTKSSQYQNSVGPLKLDVDNALLVAMADPEVVPKVSTPLVEIVAVVKFVPSILTAKGRVTPATASFPLSVAKPEMSSGLCASTGCSG